MASLRKTRDPHAPSNAGRNVSATATATTTLTAAKYPMYDRNGMFARRSPSSATVTVRPANTTAEPAVPEARPIASGRDLPCRSSSR